MNKGKKGFKKGNGMLIYKQKFQSHKWDEICSEA